MNNISVRGDLQKLMNSKNIICIYKVISMIMYATSFILFPPTRKRKGDRKKNLSGNGKNTDTKRREKE